MGPFGNLMARNGPNFDEDQEPDPNPRLVDSIISVDLLNFSSQMSTLITALGMLFRYMCVCNEGRSLMTPFNL